MRSRIPALAVLLLMAAPAALLAQQQYTRGQLYQVATWEIDPAHTMAFENAVKQVAEAANKSNIEYRWVFWQRGSTYTLVFPIDSYAYFDDPMRFQKAFEGKPGEAQMQQAMASFQNIHSEDVLTEIAELKADWSYDVKGYDRSKTKYGHIDVMWLKPGMEEAFEKVNKEWKAFFTDLGYPYPYDGHEIHFGDSGRVVYVTFIDDLSAYYGKNDLMKMIEMKNMGERWQKLAEQVGAAISRWDHYLEDMRMDMSYWPMPEQAATK